MSFNKREKELILQTLDSMLSSDSFANSGQMQNFLRFIIIKTIDGETESLKGYTIGIDALGKPESFDPTTDPSVRVMAGRLRQAIQNYYHDDASPNTPIITLAKGTYVPEIKFPPASQSQSEQEINPAATLAGKMSRTASLKISYGLVFGLFALIISGVSLYLSNTIRFVDKVALPEPERLLKEDSRLPVVSYFFEYDKNGMPDWITPTLAISRSIVALSRFDEYRLMQIDDDTSGLSHDYRLNLFFSSSIRNNGLDVFVTLYQARSNEILWSNRFTFSKPEPGGDTANLNRVESIVSSILSPYGIIYGDIINRKNPPSRLNCIRQIYEYFAKAELQSYSTGLDCAQQAVDSGDASSSMYALLAFLKVEAHRRNFENIAETALDQARVFATRAIELNEANARAHQARFSVEKTIGNEALALKAAQKALSLNPFDRDILGDYAAYLTSIGRLEEAREPLRRATELTPVAPAWLQFFQYLHADLTGNYQIADEVLATTTVVDSPLIATANILAFERSGNEAFLKVGLAGLKRAKSDFIDAPYKSFLRQGFSKTLAKTLSERVERAKASERFAELERREKT